jgi:hypothetical protein
MEFPRASGKCAIFEISSSDINDVDNIDIISDYCRTHNFILIKGDVVRIKFQEQKTKIIEHNYVFEGKKIPSSARYTINDIIYIYDGEKLEKPEYVDPITVNLPMKFHVIENDVPILYWEKCGFRPFVWFDHQCVSDQLVKNVKYGIVEDDLHGIFTTFNYNDKTYKIIFNYIAKFHEDLGENPDLVVNQSTHDKYKATFRDGYSFKKNNVKNDYIKMFKDMLSSGKRLGFYIYDDDYETCDNYTLYLVDYAD